MDEEILDYKNALKKLGAAVVELAENENYIRRLINNDNLLPLDKGLRYFIEQFRG